MGGQECLCRRRPQRRGFRATVAGWGLQGVHIWTGQGVQGEHVEGLDSTGSGADMRKARPGAGAGQGRAGARAGLGRPAGSCVPRGAGPGQTQARGPGEGDAKGACAQRPAQWEGLGGSEPALRHGLGRIWLLGGAVGILDVCEPPHPSVQELGWGGPGSGREALAGTRLALLPGLRRSARLRLWAACEIHPLLIHPLGLDPLDKAEEVLVRHGGATGQHVRGRAALVIYPGGLGGHGHAVGGLAPRPGGPAQCSAAPGTAVGRQRQLRRTARASLGPPGNQFHGQSWDP